MKQNKHLQVQQILAGEVKMETQTMFHANGDINIYPCSWENQQVTSDFKAYRQNTGTRRELLFTTRHGRVEMTRPLYRSDRQGRQRRLDMEHIYVTFKFPKTLGLALTKAIYQDECDEVMAYFKTRKEETVWQQD